MLTGAADHVNIPHTPHTQGTHAARPSAHHTIIRPPPPPLSTPHPSCPAIRHWCGVPHSILHNSHLFNHGQHAVPLALSDLAGATPCSAHAEARAARLLGAHGGLRGGTGTLA
eukprot:163280-Chlamydomonas_euryale.AAC.2